MVNTCDIVDEKAKKHQYLDTTKGLFIVTHVFSVYIPLRLMLFSIHWFHFFQDVIYFFFYKIKIDC